jgi:hypothetical protein
MRKEETRGRKSKSANKIIQTLSILQASGFNYQRTAKTTGIDRRTIKKWAEKEGKMFLDEDPKNPSPESKFPLAVRKEDLEIREQRFNENVFKMKEEVLARISVALKKSNNVRDLTESVKTLHSLTMPLPVDEDNKFKKNNTQNFLQLINNQIKIIKYGPDSTQFDGDNQEHPG